MTNDDSTFIKMTEVPSAGTGQASDQIPSTNHEQHTTKKFARKLVAKSAQGGNNSMDNSKNQIVNGQNASPVSQSQVVNHLLQRSHSTQAPIAIEYQENDIVNDNIFYDLSDLAHVIGKRRSQGAPGRVRWSH